MWVCERDARASVDIVLTRTLCGNALAAQRGVGCRSAARSVACVYAIGVQKFQILLIRAVPLHAVCVRAMVMEFLTEFARARACANVRLDDVSFL